MTTPKNTPKTSRDWEAIKTEIDAQIRAVSEQLETKRTERGELVLAVRFGNLKPEAAKKHDQEIRDLESQLSDLEQARQAAQSAYFETWRMEETKRHNERAKEVEEAMNKRERLAIAADQAAEAYIDALKAYTECWDETTNVVERSLRHFEDQLKFDSQLSYYAIRAGFDAIQRLRGHWLYYRRTDDKRLSLQDADAKYWKPAVLEEIARLRDCSQLRHPDEPPPPVIEEPHPQAEPQTALETVQD